MKISGEWLFPVTSPPLHRHSIEIEGGRIAGIRPLQEDDPIQPGICLLPGLVNTHTHLAYTGLRNLYDHLDFFPWIRKLTEAKAKMTDEQIILSTRMGILESIRMGITTVADMSDFELALRTVAQSDLRGIFFYEVFGVEEDQARESWRFLQQNFRRFQEQYSSSRLSLGISPHACYTVRPELYSWIAELAMRENIPISFHLAESKSEEEFISKRSGVIHRFLEARASDWKILGSTSVSHVEKTGILQTRPLVAHLVQADASDLEILKRYDVAVAHCPKSNAKFGHGVAPLQQILQLQLRTGLGTDGAASNNRFDLFEEARFALFQQRSLLQEPVFNEHKMLELLTIGGAKAMGIEDRIGSLELGKCADIIAVKVPSYYTDHHQVLNHLIYNTTGSDVLKTWIMGKEIDAADVEKEQDEIYKSFGFNEP